MMLLFLCGVAALLVLRVPIAVAMLLPSLIYVGLEPRISLGIVLQRITALLDSFPLLAVPLFILVGFVANTAGLADKLVAALLLLTGRIRGSLAYVNVNAAMVFSWMSGAALADAAAIGTTMIPSMRRNGYDPAFAGALTAAGSMLGPIMPPSIAAVLYSVLTGASVAATFIAAVVPAILIYLALLAYVFFKVHNRPDLITPPVPRADILPTIRGALPILGAPLMLLGGILGGVFTPTEAAGITAAYLIVLSLACGWMDLRQLWKALEGTAVTTGRVMIIASVGAMFAYIMAREQVPQTIADVMLNLTDSPWVFLLLLNITLLLVGMALEPAAAMLIFVPIIYPIAQLYGISVTHLGVIIIFNLTLGLLTPPVCLVLNVLSIVGRVEYARLLRATMPLLALLVAVLLVVTYVPATTEALPRFFGF